MRVVLTVRKPSRVICSKPSSMQAQYPKPMPMTRKKFLSYAALEQTRVYTLLAIYYH